MHKGFGLKPLLGFTNMIVSIQATVTNVLAQLVRLNGILAATFALGAPMIVGNHDGGPL